MYVCTYIYVYIYIYTYTYMYSCTQYIEKTMRHFWKMWWGCWFWENTYSFINTYIHTCIYTYWSIYILHIYFKWAEQWGISDKSGGAFGYSTRNASCVANWRPPYERRSFFFFLNTFAYCALFRRGKICVYKKYIYIYILFVDTWHKRLMGWLRFVGSLKRQVSFAKEPYKRGYILQKRLIILRSLLIVATP